MARPVASLAKSKGTPTVEILIGQVQFGKYQLILWDEDGKNPQVIATGTNDDDITDIVQLPGPVNSLHGHILSWEIIVSAPASGPGQLYSVIVTIRQRGMVVKGGIFQESGTLQGGTIVFGSASLSIS